MNVVKKITEDFIRNPQKMRMGAGKLSKSYKCSPHDIAEARQKARKILHERVFIDETKDLYIPTHINVSAPGIHILSGCQHVPFQNKKMQQGILDLIVDLGDKVKGFHILGDMMDMNSLSSHDNNKLPIPGITLGYEYAEGNKYLNTFDNVLPKNAVKTYLYGNHEDRWRRYVSDINNSKFADTLPSPKQALGLNERGYIVKDNWKEDFFILGKHLQLIHGEFCTKYPARTHVDRMKSSVAFVHTHRIDINYDGEKAGFNIGWGGDVDAPAFNYVSRLTKMNWINGFAIVHLDEQGNFFTQVIPVFHNVFWYNGKKYGG